MLSVFTLVGCSNAEPISELYPEHYFLKSGKVVAKVYGNPLQAYTKVEGADTKTFEVIGPRMGRDKDHIFYDAHIMPQADYQTMRWHAGFYKDKNHVYTGHKQLEPIINPDIDIESYQQVIWNDSQQKPNHWSKDKQHYYYKHKTLQVDYPTFQLVSDYFFIDQAAIYTHKHFQNFSHLTPRADDFKVINKHYLFNDQTLYYLSREAPKPVMWATHGQEIEAINPFFVKQGGKVILHGKSFALDDYDYESFENIGYDYFGGLRVYTKDQNKVYINESVLEGASPKNFELLKVFAKDEQSVFYKSQLVELADASTFEYVGWNYGKDNKHVFIGAKLLPEADAKSFRKSRENGAEFTDASGQKWDALGNQLN